MGRDRRILDACWPVSLAHIVSFQFSERLGQKLKWKLIGEGTTILLWTPNVQI